MNLLRRSVSVEDEVNRYSENIYETVDSHRYRNKYPRRVMRSDSDCLMMREKFCRQPVFRSEQRIKSIYDSTILSEQEAFLERLDKCANRNEKSSRMKFDSNCRLEKKKDIKSDTDLSPRKQGDLFHSGSCNVIYRPSEHRTLTSNRDCFLYSDYVRSNEIFTHPPTKLNKKPKRSNSILRHFLRSKNDVCSPLMKKNSVKRRSLSFLKRIWRKKEPKFDDDISFNTEENDMQEINNPHSDIASSSVYSAVELSMEYDGPLPEPPPDYGQFTDVEDQTAPELPPRIARGPTPWDDYPQDPEISEEPPELPVKKRKRRKVNALDFLFQDGWDPGLRRLFNEPEDCSHKDLGEIMAQLADINAAPLKYTNSLEREKDEDPDYDIPRPHDSLLLDIQKSHSSPDTMQPTHFFSQFEDSLDLPQQSIEEFTMAPDSLECDPWSLSESDSTFDNWTPDTQIRKTVISSTFGSNKETYFKDTLKLSHNGRNYLNMQNGFIQLHT